MFITPLSTVVTGICHMGIQSKFNGETLVHAVVLNLLERLHDVGHVIVMDNYFTSIGLFKELRSKRLWWNMHYAL